MAKIIKKVDIAIRVSKDVEGKVTVQESADLIVSTEEYPEFECRKGIPITLTPTQETTIINHVKNVVLPQAEASK